MKRKKNKQIKKSNPEIWLILLALVLLVVFFITNFIQTKARFLTEEDIQDELKKLWLINSYPNNTMIDANEYPKTIGVYNGLALIEKYYCSDVCPAYGGVYLVFENVGRNKCIEVGGEEAIDYGWGGYIGCKPRVDFYSCTRNDDCVSVQGNCCSCNMGGATTAVNKNYEKEWNRRRIVDCQGTLCAAVISQDPSCSKEPKCISGKCDLA
ncbi:MAG: hypothetical protein V1900_01140 [Candidatus Aenigmatarchaeota archaeon]